MLQERKALGHHCYKRSYMHLGIDLRCYGYGQLHTAQTLRESIGSSKKSVNSISSIEVVDPIDWIMVVSSVWIEAAHIVELEPQIDGVSTRCGWGLRDSSISQAGQYDFPIQIKP